jgi:hypothetical protein
MAEPLIPSSSHLEVEITVIHKLINFVLNKGELPDQCLLLYKFTKRVTKLTVVIIVGYHCYQLHTTF